MKQALWVVGLLCMVNTVLAQQWFTKTGSISFYSHTSMEDIRASNNEVVSLLDAATGELRFQLLIKAFKFPKAAMQDHFNSADYMNSDKFPKAEFKGKIADISAVQFGQNGVYPVEVRGDLTMHGITKAVTIKGKITVKDGAPSASAIFAVRRSDFGIEVPRFNAAKIADDIEVTVLCNYALFQK